jgi:hypothetical protein
MKPLMTKSKIKVAVVTVLYSAAITLAACSSNSSAQGSDQSRLAMQSNQCAQYQDCRDQDGFLVDNPGSGERLSPGVNFGRWMAGGSD